LFMKPLIPFSLLLIGFFLLSGQLNAQVKLTEKDWILPTWPVASPDKNPIFFRGEAYQGASRHYYPLALNDQYVQERIEKPWKTLVLENEYIELAVTPEIGGKLYYATDKTNGYNFIYKNNVVKPSNIGMTGAWVSGGIEWCVLHHHRASTFLPVDYTTTDNADGSKTVWIGEIEPRHGMRWTIGITVRPGKSYFEVEGRIHNASPLTHTFLYWANVAAHTNENYQTIFPPSARGATYHSKTSFTRWPFSTEVYTGQDFTSGIDISRWKNVVNSNSFFVHDLKEDFMGGYDHGKNSGTIHIGDHNIVKGAKLWEWGSGPRGQATEGRLTENDGPYVELMTGAYSDNQPDYSWIRPYEVKTWKQFWYPVKGIRGFKNANLNAAVNLEPADGKTVFLGYYATSKIEKGKVILRHKGSTIFEKELQISPDEPFSQSIRIEEGFDITDLYTELAIPGTGEVVISFQPEKITPVEELPEEVRGYPEPSTLETVEELYLTGSRVEQFYSPRHDPMDWYLEALRRDPGDIRTNTAVGNRYLKNGDYETARSYLSRAIKRLTKDYTRPASGEALYLQGLVLKAMGLYEEAVDTLYRASWDYAWHSAAYYQLAQLSVRKGEYEKALREINESLLTNARNNRSVALKAAILRKQGDPAGALTILRNLREADPLDFRLINEHYLAGKQAGTNGGSEELLILLNRLMRGNTRNFLELASGYIEDGLLSEAGDILQRFEGQDPIVDYYLGYVYDSSGNTEEAMKHFRKAYGHSTDYVFPYHLLTLEVLKTALKHNPSDDKACYYMGNILYEKQPAKAIEYWEKAVTLNPGFAIAYRNLGWGYYRHYNDGARAVGSYEKAVELNKNEPIYFSELDALYEMSNTPVETRLKLFEGNQEVVKQRDDAFIRQIAVLTLGGKAETAVKYLEGVQFAYREGASSVREVSIDARIMAGKKYLAEKDYVKALNYFLGAQIQEEEAGSSRYGNRSIQVNYYLGLAHEALGETEKARESYLKATLQESREGNIMAYYRGLAFERLGDTSSAREIFGKMVAEGNRQIANSSSKPEYGAIFGEREAENSRISQSYTLRGLGYKGLGKLKKAGADLSEAVDLSHSNLWALAESRSL
jgi:tetratricopeptide (TPR) repeat protein